MVATARKVKQNEDFEIKGKVYAFHSTTIDLSLIVFWWATSCKTKGGVKLHTLFDITTQIPAFAHITPACVNDVNAMDCLIYSTVPTTFSIVDMSTLWDFIGSLRILLSSS